MPTLQYRKSILLFRHGSRGPSKPAYALFSQNGLIREQWSTGTGVLLEDLTDIGKELCVTLGKAVREHITKEHGSLETIKSQDQIQWQSSIVERVVHSGDGFWKGFLGDSYEELKPTRKQYSDDQEADGVFRPWDTHKEYSQWAKGIERGSEEFHAMAETRWDDIGGILQSLQIRGVEKFPKATILYGMTFVRELMDCEKYYHSEVRAIHKQLSTQQLEIVDELSHWCWNIRFFKHPYVNELHSNLWDEISSEIRAAGEDGQSEFSLYSAHDYTVLVLLAGLGIPAYPELLSFCSFVHFEVFDQVDDDQNVTRVFTVSFNPAPFEKEKNFQTEFNPHATYQFPSKDSNSPLWAL